MVHFRVVNHASEAGDETFPGDLRGGIGEIPPISDVFASIAKLLAIAGPKPSATLVRQSDPLWADPVQTRRHHRRDLVARGFQSRPISAASCLQLLAAAKWPN